MVSVLFIVFLGEYMLHMRSKTKLAEGINSAYLNTCIFMFLCTLRLNFFNIFEEVVFKPLFYIFSVASESIFVDFVTDVAFSALMI